MALTGKIGQYTIVEKLGAGAMGEVYRATDEKMFGREVAVKVLPAALLDNEQARERFMREIQVVARLDHPNIITIYDWGEDQGHHYFVMEYVDGVNLSSIIADPGSRTAEQRIEIARQICDALEYAHGCNVIHRDIKPANIMVKTRGAQDHAKLMDFGIAHVQGSHLTRSQTQPGTFAYMSPEQCAGGTIDHRSDLFSMGIVLYALFTAHHPFRAATEMMIVNSILTEAPPSPREKNPTLSRALDSLLLRLLEKDPSLRPQTAGEVSEALRQILRTAPAGAAVVGAGEYRGLDDSTRTSVEGMLTAARRKEAEGALDDALREYEEASRLAPESAALQGEVARLGQRIESDARLREHLDAARRALAEGRFVEARGHVSSGWILRPDSDELEALRNEIDAAESAAPDSRERAEYVNARLRLAEKHMDEGRLDLARPPVVEILKRYPDEGSASSLLDRMVEIFSSGVPYAKYRQALNDARRAMAEGRFDDARSDCGRAREVWADDEEAKALEREIAVRAEEEISSLMERGAELVREASRPGGDESDSLRAVGEAITALERARALAADDQKIRDAVERARSLRDDLEAKVRAAESAPAAREEVGEECEPREEKPEPPAEEETPTPVSEPPPSLVEEDAERLREVRGRVEATDALAARGERKKALATLAELDRECSATEALHDLVPDIRARIRTHRSALRRRRVIVGGSAVASLIVVVSAVVALIIIEPWKRWDGGRGESGVERLVQLATDGYRRAESLTGGDLAELRECASLLDDARTDLEEAIRQEPDHAGAQKLLTDVQTLESSVDGEIEESERQIEDALTEARGLYERAAGSRDSEDSAVLSDALDLCSEAKAKIAGVQEIDAGNTEAASRLQEIGDLEEALLGGLKDAGTGEDTAAQVRSLLARAGTAKEAGERLAAQGGAANLEAALTKYGEARRYVERALGLDATSASAASLRSTLDGLVSEARASWTEAKLVPFRTALEGARAVDRDSLEAVAASVVAIEQALESLAAVLRSQPGSVEAAGLKRDLNASLVEMRRIRGRLEARRDEVGPAEESVVQAIQEWRRACIEKDAHGLQAIWPSVNVVRWKADFNESETVDVEISDPRVSFDGGMTRATVECRGSLVLVRKRASSLRDERRGFRGFELIKRGEAWSVTRVLWGG